jgi:phospholipase D1/2
MTNPMNEVAFTGTDTCTRRLRSSLSAHFNTHRIPVNAHAPNPDPAKQTRARWLIFAMAGVLGVAAVVLWRYTPLAEWADPERIAAWMERMRESAWGPIIVIAAFVIGGLIMFPLTLLITATAVVFDPLWAIVLSLSGALANAVTLYAVGRRVMRQTVRHAFGTYVDKLRRALDHSGVIAVATIRMLPVAPYTLVNLAAGSIDVRLRDYVLGTLLGILPGTIALTAFGHQLREIVARPTLRNIGLLLVVIVAWIVLSFALQRFVSKRKRPGADA